MAAVARTSHGRPKNSARHDARSVALMPPRRQHLSAGLFGLRSFDDLTPVNVSESRFGNGLPRWMLETENFGDHKSVGDGVWEARTPFGSGYRLHFRMDGARNHFLRDLFNCFACIATPAVLRAAICAFAFAFELRLVFSFRTVAGGCVPKSPSRQP